MQKSIWIIALLFAGAVAPTILRASPTDITYTVGQTVGSTGSITGTITTDGNTGILGVGDITDWNLTLNDGTEIVDLIASNSGVRILGNDLTATTTNLMFNFSASDGGFLIFDDTTAGSNYGAVCYVAEVSCEAPDPYNSIQLYDLGIDDFIPLRGGVRRSSNRLCNSRARYRPALAHRDRVNDRDAKAYCSDPTRHGNASLTVAPLSTHRFQGRTYCSTRRRFSSCGTFTFFPTNSTGCIVG